MKRHDFLKERHFYTELAGLVEKSAEKTGVVGMIIPGGRTPMPMYQRLLQHGLKIPSDFRFILSDERYCPVKSPDSNQGLIVPLLARAGADRRQVIAPDTSLPVEECAESFNEEIAFFLGNGGAIDTAILGVGSDGHTAGLFDDSDTPGGRHAVARRRADGLMGITCTQEFCRTAKSLVFVLRGATKQDIVEKMISDPDSTVAGRLGMGHPNAEIWFCLD